MQKTNNYSMFKKHSSNRALDPSNLKRIMTSIQARNLLEFRPIVVNAQFQVMDGQHRLEAAMRLGVDIYYSVDHGAKPEDMIALNINQKTWAPEDYLNYYVSFGKESYVKFKRFVEENKISCRQAVQYLSMKGTKDGAKFKMGTYNFPDDEQMVKTKNLIQKVNLVSELIDRFKLESKKITSKYKFKHALIEFLQYEDVDFDVFQNKLTINMDKIRECGSTSAYLCMLRDLYNWKNRRPLNPFTSILVQPT